MSADVCACALPLQPSVSCMPWTRGLHPSMSYPGLVLLTVPSCPSSSSLPPTHPNSITYASRLDVQGEVPRALGVRKFGQIHP